jgi:ribosomal protein L37AE/L43A
VHPMPATHRRCPTCGHTAEPAALSAHAWRCAECDALNAREEMPSGTFSYRVTSFVRFATWRPGTAAVA